MEMLAEDPSRSLAQIRDITSVEWKNLSDSEKEKFSSQKLQDKISKQVEKHHLKTKLDKKKKKEGIKKLKKEGRPCQRLF